MPRKSGWVPGVLATLCTCLLATGARAQVPAGSATTPARVRVVPGESYGAGGIHRFLLGNDYRRLWTTAIEVPVLDMHTTAGGLRAERRVGGQQTHGLALKGADGRSYTFRGLDKDPTEILPPEFHGTFVDRLLQDQIASAFPGAAVAIPPILEAAGVLHTEPVLVVLPDDSLLGEFRAEFKGLLGTFEEFPRAAGDGSPAFAGALEIINGAEMWKRIEASPETRPDARAFLTARLVDILIGDWDRHRGQWRWARMEGKPEWQPIPEDRDQAFVRFEGLVPSAGRSLLPQFVSFEDEYPSIEGLTWNGRDGDRRILVGLEKPVWDEVALDVQARITDAVIDEAIALLPAEFRKIEGDALRTALRARRDNLPEVADEFYRFLARITDVHASDVAEEITVTTAENGDVELAIAIPGAEPYYRRVFHPEETDELRIYLESGNDSLITRGRRSDIVVRVIGGSGDDVIDDAAGTHLRISDASGTNQVLHGDGTRYDERVYVAPERKTAPWIPPRDWGRRNLFFPWIGGNSDLGLLVVGGLQTINYGFRKDPYASKQTLRVGYATGAGAAGADYTGEFHRENSRTMFTIRAVASGLEFLNFYGLGNETEAPADEDFYKVEHTEYEFSPAIVVPFGEHWQTSLRGEVKLSKTEEHDDRFLATVDPYGTGDFFQAGVGAGVALDTRDTEYCPTGGVRLSVDGTVYPEVGQVEEVFGAVHGEASYYVSLPVLSSPIIALSGGGKKVLGTAPYHEAAYVGGSGTLRGYPKQRFGGDASLYGNAELRIPLGRVRIFIPGSLGIFALADAGRVYLEDESSDTWHSAAGGGVWFSFINPENMISVSIASGDEGTRLYIVSGLSF